MQNAVLGNVSEVNRVSTRSDKPSHLTNPKKAVVGMSHRPWGREKSPAKD
jgi:hypothetical protein